MFIHEPIEALRRKSKKLKKENWITAGKIFSQGLFVYTNRVKWWAQKTHISAF